MLATKLLKPIFDRLQLLPIILCPGDNNRPTPSVGVSVRQCRDADTVIFVEEIGHLRTLVRAIGPGWPLSAKEKYVEITLRLLPRVVQYRNIFT